jgi:hypothetical protein
LREALNIATAVAESLPEVSMNRHFRVIRSPSSIFTGRRQQLKIIEDAFNAPNDTQRRLIVQGPPGTGKTDLVLKYAEEQKRTYWGVFFIDASSRSRAKSSYAEIALTGGVDTNEHSAKQWLSRSNYPWLLIIDNADDQVGLGQLFPPGHLGCVLVTTRNSTHASFGTAGIKCLELDAMESGEATELLLREANEPRPWSASACEFAISICQHLHYIPLALVQAGKAIISKLCKLSDYILYFDETASRLRKDRDRRRRRDRNLSAYNQDLEDEQSMSIFGTYEMLIQSLVGKATKNKIYEEALELLQMFAYMHFQNIRLDVLIQSTVAPLRESRDTMKLKTQEEARLRKLGLETPRQSWSSWLRDVVRSVLSNRRIATPEVLPEALKDYGDQKKPHEMDDEELREVERGVDQHLRAVLKILVSNSLVMYQRERGDGVDRCYMHPFVHKWVRERPQISTAEEAIYCQMATTVLCHAVRLRGEENVDDRTMYREMKPHIDHARQYGISIQKRIQRNQQRNSPMSSRLLPGMSHQSFGQLQAQESARFSKVYLECGAYSDAEELLRQLTGYLVARLGDDDSITNLAKLVSNCFRKH